MQCVMAADTRNKGIALAPRWLKQREGRGKLSNGKGGVEWERKVKEKARGGKEGGMNRGEKEGQKRKWLTMERRHSMEREGREKGQRRKTVRNEQKRKRGEREEE